MAGIQIPCDKWQRDMNKHPYSFGEWQESVLHSAFQSAGSGDLHFTMTKVMVQLNESKTWEQCLAYNQGEHKRTGNVEILIKEAVN